LTYSVCSERLEPDERLHRALCSEPDPRSWCIREPDGRDRRIQANTIIYTNAGLWRTDYETASWTYNNTGSIPDIDHSCRGWGAHRVCRSATCGHCHCACFSWT